MKTDWNFVNLIQQNSDLDYDECICRNKTYITGIRHLSYIIPTPLTVQKLAKKITDHFNSFDSILVTENILFVNVMC